MVPMIGSWQMRAHSVPERFSAYAWSYLRAASRITADIDANPSQYGFPDANVVLLLAAHSVELFLKGMILRRELTFDIVTHRLDELHSAFGRLYPEPECRWELPFGSEYVGFSEQEMLALAKAEIPPSIRYRYPTDNAKQVWKGAQAFTAETFLLTLTEMKVVYARIEKISGEKTYSE